ncbi:spindle assembly abnormal protein 6-like protein [Plakobranchus ocellatus]|uniref:Spindle assembly abnormal protein 6-like protein n=1 Tax=Plakobranchus ocellatus TaxID=259542 RepID=A0AAV4A9B9_9GAST|nr:spindle assembly abnormal protein 6-like protein [Plakobranchus ocellatus]
MEDIFCKKILLICKAADREEKKVYVQLQMQLQSSKHDSKKELVVKLTDEQDLYFLYTLRLAEDDFQSLKMQQGLLVDFASFPQKFVDLLDMCLKESSKENPKFIIEFVSGGSSFLGGEAPCVFNIVETNPFRHLNHLSLKFLPGSDADIKSHLASCLKQMKENNSMIQYKFEHTSADLNQQLHEAKELLASKSAELDSLKLEWSSRVADVSSKHKEEMALEREKNIQFQSSLQVRFEKERRELEQAQAKLVKQLETRLDQLEASNKDLTDRKYKSEATIRDYKSRLSALEEEQANSKAELQTLRKENASLEGTRLDRDKSCNQLMTRVAVLEQELKDKAELLAKSNDLLSSEKEKKKHIESDQENKNRELGKLESKVKAMADELKKGNEIIKKLQGEVKAYHAKVKLRTQIATEQEKLLREKDGELEKLRQDLANTSDSLRDTQDKNQKLTSNLESATQKLEESRKLLKTNENMIQWLNKQINEQRVSQNHIGNFELASSAQSRHPAPVHNYSTSSHGSVLTHDSTRYGPMQRAGQPPPSTFSTNSRHQQVEYHHSGHSPRDGQIAIGQSSVAFSTGASRKSSIPVAHSGQTITTPVTRPQSSEITKDKNPPLDPKLLVRREEAIPVRSILTPPISSRLGPPVSAPAISSSSVAPPAATSSSAHPINGAITSSSSVAATLTAGSSSGLPLSEINGLRLSQQAIIPKHQHPPLASAYFPAHS